MNLTALIIQLVAGDLGGNAAEKRRMKARQL